MGFYDELERFGESPALLTEGSGEIGYRDLAALADELTREVTPRRLAFVLCENRLEPVAGYLGLLRRRAVPFLVDGRINAGHLARLCETYRPAYAYLPAERAAALPVRRHLGGSGSHQLVELSFAQEEELHPELTLLLTTSGSTGSPRLVRLSHRNIDSNTEAIAKALAIGGADRPITTMPMSYTFGLSILHSHLSRGAAIALTDASLMEKRFWQTLDATRATTFGGVPYHFEMLHKLRFGRMQLPSLRYLAQAGGKLSPDLTAELVDQCEAKSIRFIVMYGQTEATARMSVLPWEHTRAKLGSIGVAVPGGRFWLEDEKGGVIERPEEVGELVYEGDNVSLGYATCRADLARGDDNGRVLHTGDLARRDRDGFYTIVGRKTRFLKLFGNRINLDEVEQLLRAAGHECACAGVDDQLVIYATVPARAPEILETISACTGIHPRGFRVVGVERIPRHASGKVDYAALERGADHG